MKKMSPLGYHLNGFVATHALGHMVYMREHFFHDNVYITPINLIRQIDFKIFLKNPRNHCQNYCHEQFLKLAFYQ